MRRRVVAFLLAALFGNFLLTSALAAEELIFPFYTRNQNPFVQIFGLPPAEAGRLQAPHRLATILALDIANSFSSRADSNENILLDGETYRTTLAFRYGLTEDLEIGLDLPFVHHEGGIFDGFIQDWHKLFDLPQGGRDRVANDQLHYHYSENGRDRVEINGPTSGFGDILLSAAIPLRRAEGSRGRALALRTALKLPTGSSSGLKGSGSTDFSLRLSGEDRQTFSEWNVAWFGTAGVLMLTDGDISPRQRNAVGFGSLALGWQPFGWLALKVQLDGHTAFYDSGLRELGDDSMQLVLGGSLALPLDLKLELGVAEDIIVYTAPDVVFHFALRRTF